MSDLDAAIEAATNELDALDVTDTTRVYYERVEAAVRAAAEVLRPAITRQALTEAADEVGNGMSDSFPWWPGDVMLWLRDRASRVGSDGAL